LNCSAAAAAAAGKQFGNDRAIQRIFSNIAIPPMRIIDGGHDNLPPLGQPIITTLLIF
jgi:hypothetical protein